MYLTSSVTALLFLGSLAAPAIALPAAVPADGEVFLDDVWAAEGSTNATIDAVEASAVGQAVVRNACPFPIVLLRCYQQPAGCDKLEHLAANGGTHTETYDPHTNNGISLKVRRQDGDFTKNILQFEYTNRGPNLHPRINYDISEVNSDVNDFWRKPGAGGFTLTTSDPQCFHSHCPPPCTTCNGVFTQPENGTPHNCGYSKNIGITVCG